jgi:hypothetical protein
MTELPTLPERPKAEVYNVGDILTAAANGHLRVPRFQTGLRWKAPQVADLFDSIVRGFPIGGLLLWERPANAEELIFGPAFVSAPACATARYIVDGQQRVTALVGALLHPEERPMGGAPRHLGGPVDGEVRGQADRAGRALDPRPHPG